MAAAEIEDFTWGAEWHILKTNAELAEGKYAAALRTAEAGLDQYPASLELRLLARTALRFNNRSVEGERLLGEATRWISQNAEEFRTPTDRVAMGRVLLERGADPRQILELLYDPVRKAAPNFSEAYLATAELALEKYDYALAADTLNAAPKTVADDPQYHFLLARAYEGDEPERAMAALKTALGINPNHIESLLLRVDKLISAEEYAAADGELERILEINPNHPQAWAYKAVIAHLTSDAKSEKEAHVQALSTWNKNPEVDHLIGKKLSENYRFAEGAAHQRKALAFDPNYRPAKLQLAQDLLRLGEEEEGWQLADEVAKQDAYDVVAFNLVTLKDAIAKFRTIGGDDLLVRMEAREAALYGNRVVNLLQRARKTLCEKYEVKLEAPIVIEIFPKQKDFDVRTFGMPGVARGYLGVCFGRVITANSPASQGERPANWEAVLWHEFCHVVTLHKTRNKMPRWLSEGISVYEERQANPAWGQSMTPEYRELILEGGATPVSQLSSAFLSPKSPLHLQFAYFESSLVVEYLIEKYGMYKLRALLDDLGEGKDINEALVIHTEPLNRLDADFANYLRQRAEKLAVAARWDEPEIESDGGVEALIAWVKSHPNNVPGLKQLAHQQVRNKKYREALETAKRLRDIFPNDSSPTSAYAIMAAAYRGLEDANGEREALEQLALSDDSAIDAFLRLIELAERNEDWGAVKTNANRLLAVNPLIAGPYRSVARAAEKLGERDEAIGACEALLEFETTDIVETHYRLAKLLRDAKRTGSARRHVLIALEEAPRYLEAHKLLIELHSDHEASPPDVSAQNDAPPQK